MQVIVTTFNGFHGIIEIADMAFAANGKNYYLIDGKLYEVDLSEVSEVNGS